MKITLEIADIKPRGDIDWLNRQVLQFLDKCDPDDSVTLTITRIGE